MFVIKKSWFHGVVFNKNSLKLSSMISVLLLLFTSFVFGQDAGKKVFETKCFSCHSIGGGNKQGPDLKGVTEKRTREWLKEFTKSPTSMRDKDADAAQVFKDFAPEIMPDQSLSDDELDSVIALIKSLTAKKRNFYSGRGETFAGNHTD